MATLKFTTTRLGGLAAAGRVDELQHAVVAPFLDRELGPRHGRLFADFEAEGSDARAWYAEAGAPPRRVAELPPAEAEALRAAAAALLADVAALAGRLSAAGPGRATLARALAAATTFPEEDLWCDGDQPIVVNWGFHRRELPAGTPRAILEAGRPRPALGAGLAPAGAAPAPSPVSARMVVVARGWRSGWPGLAGLWLLFALLLLACCRLLLPACGLAWPFGGVIGACPVAGVGRAEAAEGARLQAEVRAAELEVAQARRTCATPEPAAPGRAAMADPQVEGRLPADAPRGAVEISLLWEGHADLDLIVDCPGGGRLWQGSPGLQSCGGRLLRDINKAGEPLLGHPIEHAAWDAPAPGAYGIEVELYGYNDVPPGTEVPFTVKVRRGADVKSFEGRVRGERATVTAGTADF